MLHFASELKALLQVPGCPRQINPTALDCYLSYGYVPGSLCILQGVQKLPPAHALSFSIDSGSHYTWRYWRLPAPDPVEVGPGTSPEPELVEELESLLDDAVKQQLLADVPIGVMLSGGVDSSLITALAVKHASRLRTFTVTFPGSVSHDEGKYAELIARHFGTEHLELEATLVTPDSLPPLARQFDEPLVDSSLVPASMLSKLVREHCTVALGGDGGDELFGGYPHYDLFLAVRRLSGWIPRGVGRTLANGARHLLPLGMIRGVNHLQDFEWNLSSGLPLTSRFFDRLSRQRLVPDFRRNGLPSPCAEEVMQSRVPVQPDALQRVRRMDFENYLPEDILVKTDRASMMNSLEVRAPWLDYRLIEFAFGRVPSALILSAKRRKILPKLLARKLLPPQFDIARKQGFSIPLRQWLAQGPWLKFFTEVLLSSKDAIFDRTFVEHLLRGQKKGRRNGERLFGLVMFELWRKEYSTSL